MRESRRSLAARPFPRAFLLASVATAAACGGEGLPPTADDCTTILRSSRDDAAVIQTALSEAQDGDVLCLRAGRYSLTRQITFASHENITLRGVGEEIDDVVLDFAEQTVGSHGFLVTANGFTIEHMWIRNTIGNGVVVQADLSTFRDLHVTWDAGSVTTNGAYAIYPNNCTRTLIENCEVVGASDAGLYVGQCEGAIIRRNRVHGNVAGIEVENTRNADVYENETWDNTAGILVLQEPHLAIKESRYVLVRNNQVHDNNRANFATEGTTVSVVPPGIGALVMAGKDTELRNNTFSGNLSTAVLIVSHDIIAILSNEMGVADPLTDPYVERVYVHDNAYQNNGTTPQGATVLIGRTELENVLWDGILRPSEPVGYDPFLCLGNPPETTYRMIAAANNFFGPDQSTDATMRTCTLAPLPMIESFDP